MIELRPLSRDEANALVWFWHRHHKPLRVCRFSIGAFVRDAPVGAVMVGNPVAAGLQNGLTFEVRRLVTNRHKHAASRLLAAAWRASRAMGVTRMVSYLRIDETGACYRAAGWEPIADVEGDGWDHGANKRGPWLPGLYEPTTEIVDRVRWEIAA